MGQQLSWRSLLGFVLLWVAWAATITSLMALTAVEWMLSAIALLFLAIAAGLVLGARALTPSWYQQLIMVTALYGVVSVIRALFDHERAGEMVDIAAFSLIASAALWIGRRVRRRYLV